MAKAISIEEARARGYLVVPKRNKYGVDISPKGKAARTYRGRCYDSRMEMKYAIHLDYLVSAGDVADWIPQPSVQLGEDTAFRPDFLVIEKTGIPYYVDVKGKETPRFRMIKKLWAKYGRLNLHVVKYVKGQLQTTEIIEGGANLPK